MRTYSSARACFVSVALVVCMLGAWLPGFANAVGPAQHVIHISVDGLNASFLQQAIESGQAAHLKRLRDEGVWTFNARTDFSHTNTLPNHTCIFTGRPTLQPTAMPEANYHNWTTNRVPKVGASLHDLKNPHIGYVASVFDVVHDAGLSTGLYATKDKFILYDQTYNENNGAPLANDPRGNTSSADAGVSRIPGRDKIDVYFYANDGPPRFSSTLHARFLSDMAERRFNYVFVHYRDTDSTGHALGWGSSGWMYALRNIDSYIGDVLSLVENNSQLAGRTVILLITDHGGNGYEHDTAPIRENYTIPILVWGAGVGRGELYAMNGATRSDPGESRPEYTEADQPIRNGDTGNLALSLLGLGPIPGSVINARQDLRVSMAGDYNTDAKVDAADYVLWRKSLGANFHEAADGNGDGRVDEADEKLWRARLGESPVVAE